MPRKKKAVASKKSDEPIQPEINIGLVGHVDHGKTTLTETLTGRWTDTHSEEIKKGITIRLGYADSVFRKCNECEEPECFTVYDKCANGHDSAPVRKVSFVDAPGHESLMATMLSGATLMDGALLLIAANEDCPQPQTKEHLTALQIIGIENVIIVQNKIDLATKDQIMKNYKQIKEFVKGTSYEKAPIIPISAQQKVNVDVLIDSIEKFLSTKKHDPKKDPLMYVARSFDVNRPGTEIDSIHGGVLGGSIKQGILKKGDKIEILPGRKIEKQGRIFWEALTTQIEDIKTGGLSVTTADPGGSIGLMTALDPSVVKSDSLTGSVVGHVGKLPQIHDSITLELHLLDRVVGAKDGLVVDPIKPKEMLMLNVNTAATVGIVSEIKKNVVKCKLTLPICAEFGSRVTISRRLGVRWRLIGYGVMKK